VVECLLDLLHAVYVRDSMCVQKGLPDILRTAGSTSFARQDTTKHTLRSGRGGRGHLVAPDATAGGLETPGENVSQHPLQLLHCQHECAFATPPCYHTGGRGSEAHI